MDLQSSQVVLQREAARWTTDHRRWQRRQAELETSAASEHGARRKAEESLKSLQAETEFLRGELDEKRDATAADNARQDRVVAKLIATVQAFLSSRARDWLVYGDEIDSSPSGRGA